MNRLAAFRTPVITACMVFTATMLAAQNVTSPRQQFGYDIGADYVLPNYKQLTEYWRKLDAESDRMVVQSIGKTAEGRDQLMAIVTSPANHAKLARYKTIAQQLAHADVTEAQARALVAEGKAVVWIDGGLHATEVLGAEQLMETVYQFVSKSDPETMRILNDVVILFVHANPDGMDLVSDWYMRVPDATKRATSGVPRLYEKYAGHDNNRDAYMNALPETENISRVQFIEWFPQIVYNHHQTGPTGSALFAPPFRDPFNYNMDPLIPASIDAVGAAMHSRFIVENKPGAVTRRNASFSTWWNGGLRTAVYFHNMVGLLTESAGNPTPIEMPFVPQLQTPSTDVFMPVVPSKVWHFRQSVDYSVTANYAVLDYASRHREQLLWNIYKMGRNSIEKGSRDNWTPGGWDYERVRNAFSADSVREPRELSSRSLTYDKTVKYYEMLREPAKRDARGYILSADQADFPTATKFVNALLKSGITVMRARAPFTVGGKSYPTGSYVIKSAQPFRPHVIDMFEPQQHPNDFQYPGGPPIAPYDNAGYTLAYQMGVQFDRVIEGFDGPFDKIEGLAVVPAGRVAGSGAGYTFSHKLNDSFTAVNRLLAAGYDVYWSGDREAAFFVRSKAGLEPALRTIAQQAGVSFTGAAKPKGDALKLKPVRIALWDQYGGSMPSGWIRYILEKFDFPFDVVYPPTFDAGDLRAQYDVILLPDGSFENQASAGSSFSGADPSRLANVPDEWRARIGRLSAEKSVPQLKAFMEQGGTVITIGSATRLASLLQLPVADALLNAEGKRLRREEFYVPGSVLEARLDTGHPLAAGMPERVYVFFDESPAFKLDANASGIRNVAWYEKNPLRSGWAWGQQYLENAVAVAEVPVGAGKLFLFGPEITFRSQPHGTYKFLFNSIFYGTATPSRVR
jgi:hypothetical protein